MAYNRELAARRTCDRTRSRSARRALYSETSLLGAKDLPATRPSVYMLARPFD